MKSLFFKIETKLKKEKFSELSEKEQILYINNYSISNLNNDLIEEHYQQNAVFMPEFTEIFCILATVIDQNETKENIKYGIFIEGKYKITDEKSLLEFFITYCKKLQNENIYYAVSLSKYDFSSLIIKCKYYDIDSTGLIDQTDRKVWDRTNRNIIDMYKDIANKYSSFELICYFFNEEIITLDYKINNSTEQIIESSKTKLKALVKIYHKLI